MCVGGGGGAGRQARWGKCEEDRVSGRMFRQNLNKWAYEPAK